MTFQISGLTIQCEVICQKLLLGPLINTSWIYSPENMVTICNLSVVCEFFDFTFTFAMLFLGNSLDIYSSNGDTGGAGYKVLSGHLVT